MKPLPRVPFAGRLCRIQVEDGLGQVLRRLHQMTGHEAVLTPLDGTKWQAFWLRSSIALTVGSAEASDIDGSFAYPFLVRAAGDRYIVVSREADAVNGFRFDANAWDTTLPPAEAARRIAQPAGFVLHPQRAWDA